MFDPEFYPTPKAVIEIMVADIQIFGKNILEPSAGKGDIVDFCLKAGANVLACEKHPELAKIVGSKCQMIGSDFFDIQSAQVSHIDYIIMNPPFKNADEHILHAYEIAPEGCTVIALCNSSTIENRISQKRSKLYSIIEAKGHWSGLGSCFDTAERRTGVDVAMVTLRKPRIGSDEFDGFFFDMTEEEEQFAQSGLMRHDEIREIVNRYVGAVKMFDSVMEANEGINSLISPISDGLGIQFGSFKTSDRYSSKITRDEFKKSLQKSSWLSVFNKMNMGKYVTKSITEQINKYVEMQSSVPFSMKNIYNMIEIIVGTHKERMDKVLVEAFDHICSMSKENSEAGDSWKTNSSYKVNRKFINGWVCECDSRWPTSNVKIRIGWRSDTIDDIVKALCFLTGKNYDDVIEKKNPIIENGIHKIDIYGKPMYSTKHNSLYSFFSYNDTPWGEWTEWNTFFRVKGFKKGTMHFEFLDEKVWEQFNLRVSQIKGWQLPKKTDKKKKGTERTKKEGIEIYD